MSINKTDKRNYFDRRKRPTSLLTKYAFLCGKRCGVRRTTDKKKHMFVDLYSPLLFIIILSILLFSFVDIYLTLSLIDKGIIAEANPSMAFHLEKGTLPFIINKFFITSASLIILCMCKEHYIARFGMSFAIIVYLSVITYQFFLMYTHHPH
jgi:hypothetical protein